MLRNLRTWFFLINIICVPFFAYSTHIVGGSLTYVYNGGSNYTVTLKLYRDCGPGTAAFPGSVTITVLGNNGVAFTPSRDITMNLGPVTPVPSNLDTCAPIPNPMPCTQQGIYTTTVNNLPPNPGGYHLYYQLIARNLSLTNINAACNCVGESFYAYIPGPTILWNEDFLLTNGTTVDNAATAWSITAGIPAPATSSVNNNVFEITGVNDAQETWTSQVINISAYPGGVNLSADLTEVGTLDPNDSIFVYYRLNGGPLIPFATNGFIADDFTNAIATQPGVIGNTIQIIIRVHYDASSPTSETYRFDNVLVYANNFINNSNPVFDLFPPLFLCVGEPFSFDHSATDADGDSLYYTFYTPYNGDNGVGPLDPTFSGNTPLFQPIVFLPGYGTTNPLGGTPLSLNGATGLLTGTPGLLGQFVVGIIVKEYRNGVYIDATLRDFQFNVINCPQFIPAVLAPTNSCTGTTVHFSNLGGSSGSNWYWDFGDPSTTTDHSTLNSPIYTYPTSGTYTVSLTTGYGTNCANTAISTVDIGWVNASFTNNAPKCVGDPVTFTNTSTSSSNVTITAYNWYFGDGGTSALQSAIHTYNVGGTYTVTLIITSNIGCLDTVLQTIVINPKPIANAGVDKTVCANNANVLLNGIVTNATGGVWTSSGTGTFSPNNTNLNTTYIPSNADTAIGSVNLYLTTTGNGICGSGKDTMKITITDAPSIANAGADQTICGVTTATISANNPIIGTGFWTLVSGTATITNPSSAITTVTGLSPGTSNVFQWTISSSGCISTSDNVIINTDFSPTIANAGNDIHLCNTTSTVLAGNIPAIGIGSWTVISGTATITTPSSPTSGITGLVLGDSVILRWTISKGVCTSFDEVKIIINKLAIVNAGIDQSFCSPTNIQLNAAITGGSATGVWTSLGSGSFSPNATTLNSIYTPSTLDISNGFATLILTSTNNQACPAITDTMKVDFSGFHGIVSTSVVNVSCFGGSNGSATVNIVNGSSPYTYFWNTSPVQTNATATGLGIGTYSVTMQDNYGCFAQATATITQPTPLVLSSVITNVSCATGSNGSIIITPTGGTAPYSYLWLPGNQTSSSLIGKPAGTYTLTVTDSKGCQVTSPYIITQPLALSVVLSGVNVSCFGGNSGVATSLVSGGTAPYTYSWSPSGGTGQNLSGASAGTYTLTVSDNKGCAQSATVIITQPTALIASITSTNETCNYMNNGTAAATVSGGTPTYSYSWQPGNQITNSISNLSSGTYTLTVTDSKGCTSIAFASISEPSTLSVSFTNQVNVSCFGGTNGSITALATGGTQNYNYLWTPGNITATTLSNITAGNYVVKVTDNNGCQVQNNISIIQPASPLLVIGSSTTTSCYGGTNGTVSSVAIGGTAPYSFNWMPGNSNSQNVSNQAAGTYTVTATDAQGCIASNLVNVAQPAQISAITSSVNSNCSLANGMASVSTTGGVGPYTYLWSPLGGTSNIATGLQSGAYTVSVTDVNGCSVSQWVNVNDNVAPGVTIISSTNVSCYGGSNGSASTSVVGGTGTLTYSWAPYGGNAPSANGLIAGTYTVTVTDAVGCQSLATTSPAITQPPPISIAVVTSNVSCYAGNNGGASVSANGGTPGYTYQWLPGGSFGSTINNLSANTYTVKVTDANLCVQTQAFSITQPNQLTASISSSTNVSCYGGNNGTASVTATGGTPFYTYNWLPSGGNGSTGTGLSTGTYTVNVTDTKGCATSTTVIITQPSQALAASSNALATACYGSSNGTATITAIGGTPGYTYQWFPSGGSGQTATGLSQGNYFVLVTDAHSCQTNVALTIFQPTPITGTLVTVNPSCGFNNGYIVSQVSGGTGPYTYFWSPGSITTSGITGVGPGIFTLQVTDAQNCTATFSSTLSNIAGPSVSISSSTNVSCYGGNNGTATAIINQGTAPYSINWSPSGGNNILASSLTAGVYTVNVIDALGCESSVVATVSEPTPLSINISSIDNVSCNNGSDGTITVAGSGGTPGYNYSWQPVVSSSATLNNLVSGTYTVNVTDQHNCASSISVNLTQPSPVVSSLLSYIDPACYNGSNGSATVLGSGGTFPYTYTWSTNPVQTGNTASNLQAGPYTVMITDNNGCNIIYNFMLTQPMQVITSAGANDTICLGQLANLTATASGGTGTYSYTWLPQNFTNNGTLTVSPSSTTTYTVLATDQNGCAGQSTTATAVVYSLLPANISVLGNTPICPGQSTTVSCQIAGLTGPVTYQWNYGLGSGSGPYTVTPLQPTTYVVTVSNSCSVSVTDSVHIFFNPQPTVILTSDTNGMCVPSALQFYDNSITGNVTDPITSWYWDFGDGTTSTQSDPVHIYNTAGTYYVYLTVSTTGGCQNNNSSAPMMINAYPFPIAAFSVNSTTLDLPYDLLNCTNQSVGADSYIWNFGDGAGSTSINPQHLYTTVGNFNVQLIATTIHGCSDTANTEVMTNADITFPNVFTPSSGGSTGGWYDVTSLSNDVFFPYTSGVTEFKLQIFNRWGELIFESTDIKQGWDGYYRGGLCQQDVYVWKAYIKLNNGKTFNKNGDVTLLR